jgi:hypothetical protein
MPRGARTPIPTSTPNPTPPHPPPAPRNPKAWKAPSGHIVVPVAVPGLPPGLMLLDTGASGFVLQAGLAARAGMARFGRLNIAGLTGKVGVGMGGAGLGWRLAWGLGCGLARGQGKVGRGEAWLRGWLAAARGGLLLGVRLAGSRARWGGAGADMGSGLGGGRNWRSVGGARRSPLPLPAPPLSTHPPPNTFPV